MDGCGFTQRERKIIGMVRDGESQVAISQALNYCDSTVDKDVKKIKRKINAYEACNLPPS